MPAASPPGRTVLVCEDSRGAEAYGCPVLSHLTPAPVAFGSRDARAKDLLFRLRRARGTGAALRTPGSGWPPS